MLSKQTAVNVTKAHGIVGDGTPHGLRPLWCGGCAAEVLMITPEKAAALAFTDLQTIFLWLELGTIHCAETPDGVLLVCPNSL